MYISWGDKIIEARFIAIVYINMALSFDRACQVI